MKQTITFEINPHEDGQDELKRVAHYEDFWRAAYEVDQYCRNHLKHGDLSEETDKHLEHIRDMLREYIPGDFL